MATVWCSRKLAYGYIHTLTREQKAEVLHHRRLMGYPLHEPPHLREVEGWFLITAATYEHKPRFRTEEDRAWLLEELMKETQAALVSLY